MRIDTCLRLIVSPTEKPGYFSFIMTGENPDAQILTSDQVSLRQSLRNRVERQDLIFGQFEAVSSWRFVYCMCSQGAPTNQFSQTEHPHGE